MEKGRGQRELRRHPRMPARLRAELYWTGDMGVRSVEACGLDVSEGGICLRILGDGPPRGVSVHLRLKDHGVVGRCEIRHRQPNGILGARLKFDSQGSDEIEAWRRLVKTAEAEYRLKSSAPTPIRDQLPGFCKHCGKRLSYLQRLRGREFCSVEHQREWVMARVARALKETTG